MPACQWFADKIEQAVQKSEQTVQFFVDASSGLCNSLNMQTKSLNTSARNNIKSAIRELRAIRSGEQIRNVFADFGVTPEFVCEQDVIDELRQSWAARWLVNPQAPMWG